MGIRKIFRVLLIVVVTCISAVLILVLIGVAPIDRSPDRTPLYDAMVKSIDTVSRPVGTPHGFFVGFAKTNMTPAYRTATAGYGKRMGALYSGIRDSIFVRSIVIDNGVQRVAIVSADLLIIPPTVTEILRRELPDVGFSLNNTYLGAVHSHNSIGNWGKGAMSFMYGQYEDSIVQFIADRIKYSIREATSDMIPASMKAGAIPLSNVVHNRLTKGGPVDSLLRVIEFQRIDSTKIAMTSFTAHATCLYSRDLQLSRDYPGRLVDLLEEGGYTFAMFLAGSVGSHTGSPPDQGEVCVDWMATEVSQGFFENHHAISLVHDSTLIMHRVPLLLAEPQAKILKNWRLRPWLFNLAFGDYPEYLTVLRVGNIVMMGTPCDFSGEFNRSFDEFASNVGLRTMITSFNGGYIGYVTPDKYYDRDHYETQLMNWYGLGNGEYMTKCMEQLLLTVADKNIP
jgi:hypothetical protein